MLCIGYHPPGNPVTNQSKHLLSVSYDLALLKTRGLLLEKAGYKVTSAESFKAASAKCMEGPYHFFVLGHSIPLADKKDLIQIFRASCYAPVLSLQRRGEDEVPEKFLALVATIVSNNTSASGSSRG